MSPPFHPLQPITPNNLQGKSQGFRHRIAVPSPIQSIPAAIPEGLEPTLQMPTALLFSTSIVSVKASSPQLSNRIDSSSLALIAQPYSLALLGFGGWTLETIQANPASDDPPFPCWSPDAGLVVLVSVCWRRLQRLCLCSPHCALGYYSPSAGPQPHGTESVTVGKKHCEICRLTNVRPRASTTPSRTITTTFQDLP